MNDLEYKKLQKYFYQNLDHLEEDKSNNILVMGVGNYIMGDEGIGVHSILALSKTELPENVDIVDGATGSFELMPILAKYPKVVLIDATMDGKAPGNVNILYPKFSSDFPTALSAHDIGLKDMIDALDFMGELPKLILITVSIQKMTSMDSNLSLEVEAAIPRVVNTVQEVVEKIEMKELLA